MPTIYHNPRCSKSRCALSLLRDHGVEPVVVDYLKTPPSASELDALCRKLGLPPEQLVRTGEARFRALGLSLQDVRGRAEWLRILSENPILIQRPIVVAGDRAVFGRPPENVLALIEGS